MIFFWCAWIRSLARAELVLGGYHVFEILYLLGGISMLPCRFCRQRRPVGWSVCPSLASNLACLAHGVWPQYANEILGHSALWGER